MQMEEQKKERLNRLDYWVTPGVVVKVKHKTLANGKYYNEKGVVQEVEARYVAHVKMLTSGDLLKIDQEMLETVLPALGGRVRIVNGAYRYVWVKERAQAFFFNSSSLPSFFFIHVEEALLC